MQENLSQQTIKTIYVGISVDKVVIGSFSPHRLFYVFDWKPAECSLWGRREERNMDDLVEGEEGEDRSSCSIGI